MKIKIQFDMNSAAFGETRHELEREIIHALSGVKMQLAYGNAGSIYDSNGNRIGDWMIEGAEG